jgi:hypothetical protein
MSMALLFLFSSALVAQNWTMPVNGIVLANNYKLSGSVVTLYKNDKMIQEVVTAADGVFNFKLSPNAEYIISITKPGFVTKKLKVNTNNVPLDRADTAKFIPFQPSVMLFEMPASPETAKRMESILSEPLAVYRYIPSEKNFNYDREYSDMIRARLAELTDLQKEAETEMINNANAAALEAQTQMESDKKYQAFINKAEKEFENKDYSNAKADYKAALAFKPEDPYAKQKIAETDKLLSQGKKK